MNPEAELYIATANESMACLDLVRRVGDLGGVVTVEEVIHALRQEKVQDQLDALKKFRAELSYRIRSLEGRSVIEELFTRELVARVG